MPDSRIPKAWADTLPGQFDPYAPEEVLETHNLPVDDALQIRRGDFAVDGAQERPSLARWMLEGLRVAFLQSPRTGSVAPTPLQAVAIVLLVNLLFLGLERLTVPGPAVFTLRNWLISWWQTPFLLGFAWWAIASAPARRTTRREKQADTLANGPHLPAPLSGGLAAWLVLSTVLVVPAGLVSLALMGVVAQQPERWSGGVWFWAFWAIYGLMLLWELLAGVVLMFRFTRSWLRSLLYAAAFGAVVAGIMWYVPDRPWTPDYSQAEADTPAPARLRLSQPVFEAQQALFQQQTDALLPERAGVADVYALVFAPYAAENVFRNESAMVREVLEQRFDAKGRLLQLLNHPETADTHLWATPGNLQRAVSALAQRMDKESDLLVVYMTSHGAQDHALAAANWPLEVASVTPEMLRAALNASGIRHRVITISACFSGGWIDTLESPSTLIMTAADATHTSYGCGLRSELTFFGRALFNEELRKTYSFTEAFQKAVPLIAQREIDAGKSDGFSNPQISEGVDITPVLQALQKRLETPGTAANPAAAD